MGFLFEACVESVYSAVQAEIGGAGRLELCSSLSQGGITPSYGLMKAVKQQISIPVHVLVRPRAGNFCYTKDEITVILEDIHMIGKLGMQGIAIGALTAEGDVDIALMRTVMKLCKEYGLSVTFHRAFDATRDPLSSLEVLVELGITRLLTSGQRASVENGLPMLKLLVEKGSDRMCIMPGGGVNEVNAAMIVKVLGVRELHGSASSRAEFSNKFHNANAEIERAMTGGSVAFATKASIVEAIVKACKQL